MSINDLKEQQLISSRQQRKLSIYQKTGYFIEDDSSIKYMRATTPEELASAYSLAYRIFRKKNYVSPKACGLRVRPYETSPKTAMFIAKKYNTVIGTFELIEDSEDLGLPSDMAFKTEIDNIRGPGRCLCEVSNQAVDFEYRNGTVNSELIRCAVAHANHVGFTDVIISVDPRTQPFYDFLGLELIGSVRSYSAKRYDPVICMRWDMKSLRSNWKQLKGNDTSLEGFLKDYYLVRNPHLSSVEGWNMEVKNMFQNKKKVVSLFGRCPDLFEDCTHKELNAIKVRLGDSFDLAFQAACGANTVFSKT